MPNIVALLFLNLAGDHNVKVQYTLYSPCCISALAVAAAVSTPRFLQC
jgi:hypothetical protein